MGYTAKAIANYFLANYHHFQISALRLQKLVYIAHGWHLAVRDGDELVNDEYAEAWQYGPVFPSLYHEFKEYGAEPIHRKAQDFELDDKSFNFKTIIPDVSESDHYTPGFLDEIWVVYKKYDATQLSALTHAPGTPWDTVRKNNPGIRNAPIPNELIRQHYEEKQAARR